MLIYINMLLRAFHIRNVAGRGFWPLRRGGTRKMCGIFLFNCVILHENHEYGNKRFIMPVSLDTYF